MILDETLNKLIRDSIDLILGVPGYSIRAKQPNAPRPLGSYADVHILTDIGRGWEEKTLKDRTADVDIDETIQGSRDIMFSINFFRSGAIDNARKVRTALVRESVQNLFNKAKVGLIARSEVRDLSEVISNTWEERSHFDLTINAIGTDQDIVRSILTVDIVGEFQARGIQYPIDIEV